MKITSTLIEDIIRLQYRNYAILPRWIRFCRTLLQLRYTIHRKQSAVSTSVYLFVSRAGSNKEPFIVRFGDHRQSNNGKKLNYNVGIWESDAALTTAIVETTKYFFQPKAVSSSNVKVESKQGGGRR
jgi:hypothetical protein